MAAMGRDAYLRDSLETASPGRIVVMLYDTAVRDLAVAERALESGEHAVANGRLVHAQAILLELYGMLDVAAWEGAPTLANLYLFLVRELIDANVGRDQKKVATCRDMLESLAEVWQEALMITGDVRTALVGSGR